MTHPVSAKSMEEGLVTSRFTILCRLDENGDQWMRVAHLLGPGPQRITTIDRTVREYGCTGWLMVSNALRVRMEVLGLHVPAHVRDLVHRQRLLVHSIRENTIRLALFQRKETTHYINKANIEEFKIGNESLAEPLSWVRPPSGSIVAPTSGSMEAAGSANARASYLSASGCAEGPSLPAAWWRRNRVLRRLVLGAQLAGLAPSQPRCEGGKSVPHPRKQKVGAPAHVLAVPPRRLAHLEKQIGLDRNLHPLTFKVLLRWSLPKQLLAQLDPVVVRALYHRLPLNGEAQLDGHVLQSDRGLPDADGHMKCVGLRPPPHDEGRYQVPVIWEVAGSRCSVKAGRYQERNKCRWRITITQRRGRERWRRGREPGRRKEEEEGEVEEEGDEY
ncbi:Serine/threonine-protein phosphatase 7 long form-like protein [Senna tora]|uniref:Serine/threonine-protein phosphatase 7 long form-like protein n=1 Tax=Senna tora TaxID=362788 RepID=A0A834SQV0_9FABA|nr:Serine/threonine-protein phosphatase 7 long form-like protein [Senna tora]